MRLFSTPDSVDRGEVSLLAVAETFLAMGLSVAIARHYDTLSHIAISATLAPLFLLRTKRSTVIGIHIFDRLAGHTHKKAMEIIATSSVRGRIKLAFPSLMLDLADLFFPLIAKYYALTFVMLRWPLQSVAAIPLNWHNVVLSTDLARFPEVVPGYEKHGKSVRSLYVFKSSLDVIFFEQENFLNRVFFLFFIGPVFLVVTFGPALVYRFSLKSTALIWSPLLWVIWRASSSQSGINALKLLKSFIGNRVARIYSAGILLAFAFKLLVLYLIYGAGWPVADKVAPTLDRYLQLQAMPMWQIGGVVNAALAWGMFFFADHQLKKLEIGDPTMLADGTIRTIISTSTVLSSILALYSSLCLLLITWSIQWPSIQVRWWP